MWNGPNSSSIANVFIVVWCFIFSFFTVTCRLVQVFVTFLVMWKKSVLLHKEKNPEKSVHFAINQRSDAIVHSECFPVSAELNTFFHWLKYSTILINASSVIHRVLRQWYNDNKYTWHVIDLYQGSRWPSRVRSVLLPIRTWRTWVPNPMNNSRMFVNGNRKIWHLTQLKININKL